MSYDKPGNNVILNMVKLTIKTFLINVFICMRVIQEERYKTTNSR